MNDVVQAVLHAVGVAAVDEHAGERAGQAEAFVRRTQEAPASLLLLSG